MAIVPEIGEQTRLEGQQTLVASEPDNFGAAPDSLDYQAPDYLSSQYTPQPASSSPAAGTAGAGVSVDFSGGASAMRDKLVSNAMRYIGQPYVWGALDCSGLMQRGYASIGIHLPRISYQQADYGQKTAIKNLSVGDLVAWDEGPRNPGADHVAMFIGFDSKGRPRILEAAHTGTDVRVRVLGANEGAWGVHIKLPGE
jgi:cell wall-associated NlpC family hydrolase